MDTDFELESALDDPRWLFLEDVDGGEFAFDVRQIIAVVVEPRGS